MNNLRKSINSLLVIMALGFAVNGFSQDIPPALQQQLAGKTRFADIMKAVDTYYNFGRKTDTEKAARGEREHESPYVHWKRFENFYINRLNADGTIPNNVTQTIWNNWEQYKKAKPQYFTDGIQQNSSYGNWLNFGPTTITRYGEGWNSGYGRVNCIAFHPTVANTMYIGLPQGGIWRTTDGGTTWGVLTDDLPSCGISGLVVDWNNANTIYALTGDGDVSHGNLITSYGYDQKSVGVLKSTTGGATWSLTGNLPNAGTTYYGYKLIQHPTNSNTLFAATTAGIYRTTNGGSSWTEVETDSDFTDIEFKPGSPNTMYAVRRSTSGIISNPLYRSTDGGATWSNTGITGLPTNAQRMAIAVTAANSNYVYILAGPAAGVGSFRGLYRSTNSGVDFTNRATTPNVLGYPTAGDDARHQTLYDLAAEADPDNANTVLTAGINIWRSTDGGTTLTPETQWFNDTDDAPKGDYVHADVHNLTYNPLNGFLYACTDGGVGRSTNDGASWTFLSGNLHILATYHADWYEANASIMACGTQDNGVNHRNTSSNTYRHIQGADGYDAVIHQDNPLDMVVSWNSAIVHTTDGGLTSTGRTPTDCDFFPSLARSFADDDDILAGDANNVYRSTNRGATWTTETTPAGNRVLTTCQSNSNRVYASNGSTLWRSDDKGDTWTTISGNTNYPTGVTLTDVEATVSNSTVIWASFGGYTDGRKVFSSNDSGRTWTNRSGSLPNLACHSITVDENNSVYVGTDVGVFVRPSGESDWQPFLNGLPRCPVSELMVNNSDNSLIATTYGRGNWQADFYSICPASGTLNVGGSLSGKRFYEYPEVRSTATMTSGAGTDVAMKGIESVTLQPGFEVRRDNVFRAYIGPCGNGGVPLSLSTIRDVIEVDRLHIPAENGKRFPYARISSVDNSNHTATIKITEPGQYTLRIDDANGNPLAMAIENVELNAGKQNISLPAVPLGSCYLHLLKEKRLVHFQEYRPL
ncbi:MAG: hypothetical protein EAY75_09710 [Bacteroidetes bacterium]|nr:MAG: hypothetical protein EAY75_09710 [Bacteroidota bacterium]